MYLKHDNLDQFWVLDIETDGLKPTLVHCIVVKNVGTKEKRRYVSAGLDTVATTPLGDFRGWADNQRDAIWIGHNAISYDVPNLRRLLGVAISDTRVVDTLVLSTLYHPKMPGGHGLAAWGERLKVPKGKYNDWTKFTPEMLAYCEQDVDLTELVFLKLTEKMLDRKFTEKACSLEHEIRVVVDQQERNGFYFDIPRAEGFLRQLRDEQAHLAEPIQRLFPPALARVTTIQDRKKPDGSPYQTVVKARRKYDAVRLRPDGKLDCLNIMPFQISSPDQRRAKLYDMGWKPEQMGAQRTKSGENWSADEEAFIKFLEFCPEQFKPEVKAMSEWLVVYGRGNMVETWLKAVNYVDSCIHGRVWTCGAGSRRMTHTGPNTANVPKADPKVKYGRECRELWRARPGRVMVGYDAKSLEMMMFLHYLGASQELIDLYVNGDPHARNADALGLPRSLAKNVFYAFLYGAQDAKLGQTAGGRDTSYGALAREALFSTTPGLKELTKRIQYEYKNTGGFLKTIDGGYVRCPSPHAALNYLCQSAGGIVMKQASIFIARRATHLDHLKVGDIHDEGQHDTAPADADQLGGIAVQAIRDAGQELNFAVPLDGDYKVGATWADTH